MLFEKQRHYFDVIVEISSSLHKMGKMGRKKKLDEILLPHQLVIFSLKNHPQLRLGLLRMVKKKSPAAGVTWYTV